MEGYFIAGLICIFIGGVGGYMLASHIHSIAAKATSNAVIGGAASAITVAIATVHNDVKAIASKIDHIVVAAPTAPIVPTMQHASPAPAPAPVVITGMPPAPHLPPAPSQVSHAP